MSFKNKNHTANVAVDISAAAGADLFEIIPEIPYSVADLDWMNPESRSSVEMAELESRPAVKN
jgi:hypothetical protein